MPEGRIQADDGKPYVKRVHYVEARYYDALLAENERLKKRVEFLEMFIHEETDGKT